MLDALLEALPVVCPLRATTGLDCPLCGASRATAALVRGDLGAAIDFNALYVLVLPVALAVVAWWLVRGETPAWSRRPFTLWSAGAVAATFAVARNLPWEPLAALAS